MKYHNAFKLLLVFFAVVALLYIPATSEAQRTPGEKPPWQRPGEAPPDVADVEIPEDNGFQLKFEGTEIAAVAESFSKILGKAIVLPDGLRGRVYVYCPRDVTKEEAYLLFQAALNLFDYTLVTHNNIIKIVKSAEAKSTDVTTITTGRPISPELGDTYVTMLIPMQNIDVSDLSTLIKPLISKHGNLITYAPTNTLILTEAASNIKRILKIIKEMDVSGTDTIVERIPLQYANSETLLEEIKTILGLQTTGKTATVRRTPRRGSVTVGQAQEPVLISDERTNSIIVLAEPDDISQVKALIAILDVKVPPGRAKVNVFPLKNADAEELVKTLKELTQKTKTKRAGKAVIPGFSQFEEEVQITADKSTNSLIIIASPLDYEVLKDVIMQLDRIRPQVLVEALIMEISMSKSRELGVEWRSSEGLDNPSGDYSMFGGTNFDQITPLMTNPLAAPQGLVIGAIKGTLTYGGKEYLNIAALINALQTDSDVNILSTPHIVATDNEEAEIVVADNIPYQTSQKYDSNGNPIYTFEYRDVGITLRLTPTINDAGNVRLELYYEISQLLGIENNAPTTSTRQAKTTVNVRDNETIVIGGLMKDNIIASESKVPFLGDIPLLGFFFKSSNNRIEKTNLLIFMTPRVITTSAEMERISLEKLNAAEDFRQRNKITIERDISPYIHKATPEEIEDLEPNELDSIPPVEDAVDTTPPSDESQLQPAEEEPPTSAIISPFRSSGGSGNGVAAPAIPNKGINKKR
jgi:general secretion pathway protein D